MHRLILFNETAALATDSWRLRSSEVIDMAKSADLLARCRQRLTEVEALCGARLEEASAEGFAAGFAAGQASAGQEAAVQLQGFLANLSLDRAGRQAAVGRLAMDVVQNLLGDMDVERSIELFVVRRFEDLEEEEPLEVRVPSGRGPGIARRLKDRSVSLRVVEDSTLAVDECAFDLGAGRAHARLSLRLEALKGMICQVEAVLAEGEGLVV